MRDNVTNFSVLVLHHSYCFRQRTLFSRNFMTPQSDWQNKKKATKSGSVRALRSYVVDILQFVQLPRPHIGTSNIWRKRKRLLISGVENGTNQASVSV
jgi:hypothetical protein